MALLQDTVATAPASATTGWFARHYVATALAAALLGAASAVAGALVFNASSGWNSDVDQYGISTKTANSPIGDGERAARRMLENAK